MSHSAGVATPRARRRRPTPDDFGLDLDWELGSSREARPSSAEARLASPEPDFSDTEPWFAALPAELLAPLDEAEARHRRRPASEREPSARAAVRAPLVTQTWLDAEAAGEPAPVAEPPRTRSAAPEWAPTYDPVTGRRTVTIRGRGSERYAPAAMSSRRDRPAVARHERSGFHPDRAAMWAVVLGILLVLIAVTSAHAAMLH